MNKNKRETQRIHYALRNYDIVLMSLFGVLILLILFKRSALVENIGQTNYFVLLYTSMAIMILISGTINFLISKSKKIQ